MMHEKTPREAMRRAPATAVLLGGLLACSLSFAQAPAPGTGGGANGITQSAVQKGIFRCAGRINQLTNVFTSGAPFGAMVMTPTGNIDQKLVPITMELKLDNGVAFVSSSFAPTPAGDCGASFDMVTWWPEKCVDVAGKVYPRLKAVGFLHEKIGVLDAGSNSKVFLMDAGPGCVSIKTEFVNNPG
jgi:hypothetical protein